MRDDHLANLLSPLFSCIRNDIKSLTTDFFQIFIANVAFFEKKIY